MKKPSLAICMIFRNEERFLPGWIQCFANLADEYVLLDTGSTDQSVRLLREAGFEVHSIPWAGDFSKARNEYLKRTDASWILALDADDRMKPADLKALGQFLEGASEDAYLMRYVNLRYPKWPADEPQVQSEQVQARLFRGDRGFYYEGAIHENLLPSVERAGGKTGKALVPIYHLGYAQELLAEKIARNEAIVEREFVRNPGDPALGFYKALSQFGPNGSCARLLFDSYQRAGGSLKQRVAAKLLVWHMLYRSSPMQDQEFPPARIAGNLKELEEKAIGHAAENAVGWVSRARRAWDEHKVLESKEALKEALVTLHLSQDGRLFLGEVLDCLGIAHAMDGELKEADEYFERYFQEVGPSVHNTIQRLKIRHAFQDVEGILAIVEAVPPEWFQELALSNFTDALLKAQPSEKAQVLRERLRRQREASPV